MKKEIVKNVGKLNNKVIKLLNLSITEELPIILTESSIEHIKSNHEEDYLMYGSKIKDIINNPTYIARNPKQGSIEYIKEYKVNNSEYVLVAVRASSKGQMFVRTMFKMTMKKINTYLNSGYAVKY